MQTATEAKTPCPAEGMFWCKRYECWMFPAACGKRWASPLPSFKQHDTREKCRGCATGQANCGTPEVLPASQRCQYSRCVRPRHNGSPWCCDHINPIMRTKARAQDLRTSEEDAVQARQWDTLSERQRRVLVAMGGLGVTGPTNVGQKCGQNSREASGWASPVMLSLVRIQLVERLGSGRYRLTRDGQEAAAALAAVP